jgi:acetyl-CoA acetyltransferase
MREVCVVGTGIIPFGKFPEKALADIGWPAVKEALVESKVPPKDIDAVYCGTALGGMMAGQRIMKNLGITGIPITNIENACSSSSTTLAQAWLSIASGLNEVVIVVGVEKLTKFGGGTLPLEREDWEVNQGQVMPAVYAMRAQRYMHEYGLTVRQLGEVAVKALHASRLPHLPRDAARAIQRRHAVPTKRKHRHFRRPSESWRQDSTRGLNVQRRHLV